MQVGYSCTQSSGRRNMQALVAEGVLTAFLHGLRVAANSAQMGEMIEAAKDTRLISDSAIETAWEQMAVRGIEEEKAVEELHHDMAVAQTSEEMQRVIDTAMYGGRVDHLTLKRAKEQHAEQLAEEQGAKGVLERSALLNEIDDHGDSTTVAIAIVKAEEGGLVDPATLDKMWELQVERAENEDIAQQVVLGINPIVTLEIQLLNMIGKLA